VIRQNRAIPILLVLTFAFILYLGGCFGSEKSTTAIEESPIPVSTPTVPPVVDPTITPEASEQERFYHTVETGDLLGSIASKYNVTVDVIIRANPQMDPNLIIAGEKLLIPGAGTNNEVLEYVGPDRPDGVTLTYVGKPRGRPRCAAGQPVARSPTMGFGFQRIRTNTTCNACCVDTRTR
jgi:LysM repeat protein